MMTSAWVPDHHQQIWGIKVLYIFEQAVIQGWLRLQFKLSSKVEFLGPRTTIMAEYLCT
jgi:hypothetical protein